MRVQSTHGCCSQREPQGTAPGALGLRGGGMGQRGLGPAHPGLPCPAILRGPRPSPSSCVREQDAHGRTEPSRASTRRGWGPHVTAWPRGAGLWRPPRPACSRRPHSAQGLSPPEKLSAKGGLKAQWRFLSILGKLCCLLISGLEGLRHLSILMDCC